MKLTIKSQNEEKIIQLKSNLKFDVEKGEQYVFSNGFSNYVLSFKDNQESVVLAFTVDGKVIEVELKGIVPYLQANNESENPTSIIINKGVEDKDIDSILANKEFNGSEIIDRLESLISSPTFSQNKAEKLSIITDFQTLVESLGAAAAGGEAAAAGGNEVADGSTFNSIFSTINNPLNGIADEDRWVNLTESITSSPVETGNNVAVQTVVQLQNVNIKLIPLDADVFESENATYKITLTDDNGNPVLSIEPMIVTLNYIYGTATSGDITETITVTIPAGVSEISFDVETLDVEW